MGAVLNYQEQVTKAMGWLAQHPKTIFVGQAVRYDGQRLHATLRDVPMDKRIEMPVCEDFQMGFCTGLALEGYVPVSIYPRWDFLILAANQLVNHLDKIPLMGGFKPKVIIRTAVGSKKPLDPGHQHTQDHSEAFAKMLQMVSILQINNAEEVAGKYSIAMNLNRSVIVVEHMDQYK
jgi:pyruvate/2-oxoglutarate/acetoin dehydrogenase E1 component